MLRIAIAGLGTVGTATLNVLQKNQTALSAKAGCPITVTAVSARDRTKKRDCDLGGVEWVADPTALASRSDVDVVVELMGGAEGAARQLAESTLKNGKHLVTANKALLATHGAVLAELATTHKSRVGFEAAVAGGIPVIKVLREGLAANTISVVRGILNGTCNYILTEMRRTGIDFATALSEAQRLGYAEADPSADVDGHDTAHKLAILSALAFGSAPTIRDMDITGIRAITPADLGFADDLGCRIKLLGVARKTERGVEQHVAPCLVSEATSLAHVNGVTNAVLLRGDLVGDLTLEGRGAGSGPTASAVIADIMDIARDATPGTLFATKPGAAPAEPIVTDGGTLSRYYIRLEAKDQPGVVADIAAILRDEAISIESLLQHAKNAGASVPVVITTHKTGQGAMKRAAGKLKTLPTISGNPCIMTIED